MSGEIYDFVHDGLGFSVRLSANENTRKCRSEALKLYSRRSPRLITGKESGLPVIDWQYFIQIEESTPDGVEIFEIKQLLEILGVLTYRDQDIWQIIGCGLQIGPTMGSCVYSFVREEDAKAWLKAYNVSYSTRIIHIDVAKPSGTK